MAFDMNPELELLVYPKKIYSGEEVLSDIHLVPKKPGIYAWFFTDLLPLVPTSDCIEQDKLKLLYIGIAPRKPTKEGSISKSTLRNRIIYHYKGNAYGSTLRLTLGCLLSEKLDIHLRRVGKRGRRMNFTQEGEHRLSCWMEKNAFVTWIEREYPWELEKIALKEISLPFNLKGNKHHPFYNTLKVIRRRARDQARKAFS